MSQNVQELDQKAFFEKYRLNSEDIDFAEASWKDLDSIFQKYSRSTEKLKATGVLVSGLLSQLPAVHSLKVRVKDPEHLIEKIIRKRFDVTVENYQDTVMDLIGIRALHLFKEEWQPIHEFVMENWSTNETPIAYIRGGDPEPFERRFEEFGCEVRKHDFGYRSVHYLIRLQPTKEMHIAELQVRTIFEEAWSEIDHRVRYPRHSDDPRLAEFLTIFNRLAGSADEMGTFIKNLRESFAQQASQLSQLETRVETVESELREAISELEVSNEKKKNLEALISELRKASERRTVTMHGAPTVQVASDLTAMTIPSVFADAASQGWSVSGRATPAIVGISGSPSRVCTKCGRPYIGTTIFVGGEDVCPECRYSVRSGGPIAE